METFRVSPLSGNFLKVGTRLQRRELVIAQSSVRSGSTSSICYLKTVPHENKTEDTWPYIGMRIRSHSMIRYPEERCTRPTSDEMMKADSSMNG